MLSLQGIGSRTCDGVTRREFLRVGGLGLSGLTLPALLASRANGATRKTRAKSCIQLFMWGGPAHQETFDLKPHAPQGIGSMFRPIATRVPGIQICEHLPALAKMTDQFAIIRSLTHPGVNHGTSAYHMLTGHLHPAAGPGQKASPTDMPQLGCVVARYGRTPPDVPAHVALPSMLYEGDGRKVPGQEAGILGQRYAPFWVIGDPTREDFSLDTLRLPNDLNPRRFQGRMSLQAALDRRGEHLARQPASAGLDRHYEQAYRLLRTGACERAFRLAEESHKLRQRYGWHHFGQSCLLARRLVEAGVPLITVYWNTGAAGAPGNWDTHDKNSQRLQTVLLPPFEQAMTALLEDLKLRGLLDETLVVWMGEFGRTPRINRNAGRDHWGFCQSVLLAGGGVRGGQVHGRSDAHAAFPAADPVTPDDLAATILDSLGVPRHGEIHDAQGRPMALCKGRPIQALFG